MMLTEEEVLQAVASGHRSVAWAAGGACVLARVWCEILGEEERGTEGYADEVHGTRGRAMRALKALKALCEGLPREDNVLGLGALELKALVELLYVWQTDVVGVAEVLDAIGTVAASDGVRRCLMEECQAAVIVCDVAFWHLHNEQIMAAVMDTLYRLSDDRTVDNHASDTGNPLPSAVPTLHEQSLKDSVKKSYKSLSPRDVQMARPPLRLVQVPEALACIAVCVREHGAHTELLISCFRLMGHLASDLQSSDAMADAKLCEVLCAVMSDQWSDPSVQVEGIYVIARMAEASTRCSQVLGENNACSLVCKAIKLFPDNQRLLAEGIRAIAALALFRRHRKALRVCGACYIVPTVLMRKDVATIVARDCLRATSALADHNCCNVQLLRQHHAIEGVARAASRFTADAGMQSLAQRATRTLGGDSVSPSSFRTDHSDAESDDDSASDSDHDESNTSTMTPRLEAVESLEAIARMGTPPSPKGKPLRDREDHKECGSSYEHSLVSRTETLCGTSVQPPMSGCADTLRTTTKGLRGFGGTVTAEAHVTGPLGPVSPPIDRRSPTSTESVRLCGANGGTSPKARTKPLPLSPRETTTPLPILNRQISLPVESSSPAPPTDRFRSLPTPIVSGAGGINLALTTSPCTFINADDDQEKAVGLQGGGAGGGLGGHQFSPQLTIPDGALTATDRLFVAGGSGVCDSGGMSGSQGSVATRSIGSSSCSSSSQSARVGCGSIGRGGRGLPALDMSGRGDLARDGMLSSGGKGPYVQRENLASSGRGSALTAKPRTPPAGAVLAPLSQSRATDELHASRAAGQRVGPLASTDA